MHDDVLKSAFSLARYYWTGLSNNIFVVNVSDMHPIVLVRTF